MRWSSQTYQHAQAWYSSLLFFKGQYWKDCFFKSLCLKFVYVCFYSPYMYRFCRFDLRKGLHIIYVYIYIWKSFEICLYCWLSVIVLRWSSEQDATLLLILFQALILKNLHRAKALQIQCLHPVLVIPFKIILGRLNWKVIVLEFNHCSSFFKILFFMLVIARKCLWANILHVCLHVSDEGGR